MQLVRHVTVVWLAHCYAWLVKYRGKDRSTYLLSELLIDTVTRWCNNCSDSCPYLCSFVGNCKHNPVFWLPPFNCFVPFFFLISFHFSVCCVFWLWKHRSNIFPFLFFLIWVPSIFSGLFCCWLRVSLFQVKTNLGKGYQHINHFCKAVLLIFTLLMSK